MRPHTLEEFAQELRVKGNFWEVDFADEILALIDIEEEVAEPYSDLCADLEHATPSELKDKPAKALEWLTDRSNLLEEIETELKEAGREREGTQDTADVVKEIIGTLGEAEDILEAAGWPGDGDFIDGIQSLADRPAPPEYDL